MAKKQARETFTERALKYCVAHQYPEVILRKTLALRLYGNANWTNQTKLLKTTSDVSKSFRQDHPRWHLFLSPVWEGRRIAGWIATDNPYDWMIDVLKAATILESFGDRIIDEAKTLDINKLSDEEKEKIYEIKANNKILARYLDTSGQDYRELLKLIPMAEWERRKKMGMRIPKMLEEKIEEVKAEEEKKIWGTKSEKVDKTQTKEPSGKTKEKAKTYKYICEEHNIKTNNRISWNLHIRAKHPDMQEVR